VEFTASMKAGLSGRCTMIDEHRAVALSGIVAASMAGMARVMRIFALKMC
jgi:hypothetical protein